VERDDGSLLVSGWTSFDVMAARLAMPLPEKRDYQTAAGFVLERLGRLPKAGDSFTERSYRFEVIDMDGRRIDKLLVLKTGLQKHRLS
jgi:putative hemolysin